MILANSSIEMIIILIIDQHNINKNNNMDYPIFNC